MQYNNKTPSFLNISNKSKNDKLIHFLASTATAKPNHVLTTTTRAKLNHIMQRKTIGHHVCYTCFCFAHALNEKIITLLNVVQLNRASLHQPLKDSSLWLLINLISSENRIISSKLSENFAQLEKISLHFLTTLFVDPF